MQAFQVGQKIRVLNNSAAFDYGLSAVVGQEFEVTQVDSYGDARCDEGFFICPNAAEIISQTPALTTFQRVAEMNTAFGNPKGDSKNVDWDRIRSQFKNVFDEYCEGLVALGYSPFLIDNLKTAHAGYITLQPAVHEPDAEGFRDATADAKVFLDGGSHLAGFDGDADMHLVIDAVMTRFIKNPADKGATQALHASKGVTDVYFEGEYPKMVMKSASDQPDAPKGKFLKSASYSQPVFPAS